MPLVENIGFYRAEIATPICVFDTLRAVFDFSFWWLLVVFARVFLKKSLKIVV